MQECACDSPFGLLCSYTAVSSTGSQANSTGPARIGACSRRASCSFAPSALHGSCVSSASACSWPSQLPLLRSSCSPGMLHRSGAHHPPRGSRSTPQRPCGPISRPARSLCPPQASRRAASHRARALWRRIRSTAEVVGRVEREMSATARGKLPCRRALGSCSSARSPMALLRPKRARTRSSPHRCAPWTYACASQKLQARKAPLPGWKPILVRALP